MKKDQQEFSTLDIYLSAFIELNGIPAELKDNGRIVFIFPYSEKVRNLCSKYNGNMSVPVADFVSILRTLKARMFAMKERK
jgi:hypothetical protein